MELLSGFDPMDTNLLPTFSYIDISSMVLKGPFCSNCMNLKKWKLSQLSNKGKLMLHQHLVGENVGRELWDLQLRNGTERPFSFWKPLEGFLPLPCSEMTCSGNKSVSWYREPQNSSEASTQVNLTPETLQIVPTEANHEELCSQAMEKLGSVKMDQSYAEMVQTNEKKFEKLISALKYIAQENQQPQKMAQNEWNNQNTTELSKVENDPSLVETARVKDKTYEDSNECKSTMLEIEAEEIFKTHTAEVSAPVVLNPVVPPPSKLVASDRVPFFHPSVAVKKQLDINADLHNKIAQMAKDKEFPKFIKLLGEKFPFSKTVTFNTKPFVRCDTCDKSFNTWTSLVTHTFRRSHIVKMYQFGHVFDAKDLEVVWNTYQEACVMVPDEKLTNAVVKDSETICDEVPNKPHVSPLESSTTFKTTHTAADKSSSLIKTDFGQKDSSGFLEKNTRRRNISRVTSSIVLNTDRVDLPFSMGSANISVAYPERELPSLLAGFEKRLSVLSADVIEMVLDSKYRLPENSKCWTCKKTLATFEWISHLITKEHIEKLGKCGQMARLITFWDVKRMHQLIQDCEKKAAEFPSLQEEKSKKSRSVEKAVVPKKSPTKLDGSTPNPISSAKPSEDKKTTPEAAKRTRKRSLR